MSHPKIFLDGKTIEARPDLLESLAPGLVKGRGIFETMRVHNGRIFALEDHLRRMYRGLRLMNMASPYSKERWGDYLYQAIRANCLKEARIRLAIWKEQGKRHIAIVGQSVDPHALRKNKKGMMAMFSSIERPKTKYSNIKSLDYSCFREAMIEARQKGIDEAILLNGNGNVVEGSRSNIFFVKKGTLLTPSIECGCLNGITRSLVLKIAEDSKIPYKEVDADKSDLLSADEAFVTNALIGIVHLNAIGETVIGDWTAGPITQKCQRAYDTIFHSSCPARCNSI